MALWFALTHATDFLILTMLRGSFAMLLEINLMQFRAASDSV